MRRLQIRGRNMPLSKDRGFLRDASKLVDPLDELKYVPNRTGISISRIALEAASYHSVLTPIAGITAQAMRRSVHTTHTFHEERTSPKSWCQ